MKWAIRSRSDVITGSAIVVVCPIVAALTVMGGPYPMLAVAGIVVLIVGVYVGLRHPLWTFWGLAAVLGGLPFGYFPGVHVPLYLPFAAGALLAAIVHPTERRSFHPLETAVLLLVVTSAFSVIFTARTTTDVAEYIKWTIASLLVIALLRLSRENMARFGRIFVYATTANALFGIAIVTADPNHKFIKIFSIFGYDREETGRFVFSNKGESRFTRLGGTWVDPNGAGIAFGVALVLCIILLRGKMRAACTAILSVAILLTLSRAAIFSVLVGLLLVLLFHTMRSRDRQIALGGIGLVVVGSLLTPFIRKRIFTSFGSDDTGASARGDALTAWPHQMSGHWLFGLGWGRPEFKNGAYSFKLNIVANAPLIAAYRAGIIVGLVFVAVLVIGCVVSYRALRSDSLPWAIYGGVFIGFTFVALQLDHPVVDIPQTTLTYSVFLAFLVHVDRSRQSRAAPLPGPTVGADAVPGQAHYVLQ